MSDTQTFTGPFIVRHMSWTKPMASKVLSNTRDLRSAERDMNKGVYTF